MGISAASGGDGTLTDPVVACLSEAPKKERFGGEQIDLGLPLQLELQKQDLGFGQGGCW